MSTRSCNGKTDSIKYQGFTQNYTTESLQTTITYQSGKETLMNNIQATTGAYIQGKWRCGQYYEYGRLDNINVHNDSGPFWNATLTFSQPLSSGIIVSSGDDTKPTQNSLTVRMMSMPLQSHPKYKYAWNHVLAKKGDNVQPSFTLSDGTVIGSWDAVSALNKDQAADLINVASGVLKWLDDVSQLPTETWQDEDNPDITQSWNIAHMSEKPGVETYDFPTYEIQEHAKHTNRNQATWSLLAKNGKLAFPQYGDFGIESYFYSSIAPSAGSTSGHWLCEGAGIDFDGKYYIANCTYLFSPDPFGWDLDLYEVASGGYTVNNNNSIFNHGGN